ncbi:MAG: hypothetical protein FJ091_07945 [Deltaproteobacteria bacterium]|nr:hypothetical protein [Deltaproteobacteria bacterium]
MGSSAPNPYAPPTASLDEPQAEAPPLFAVSAAKLLLLSLFTFGLYTTWWSYKNWRAFDGRDGERLMPIPRAIFSGFTNFSLFSRTQRWATSKGTHTRVPHELFAIASLVMSVAVGQSPFGTLWPILFIMGMGAAHLPSNALAARVNLAVAPNAAPTVGWTTINIVGVVLVGILVALVGFLVPRGDAQ